METVRLRLVFDDRNMLSKSQKKQGLRRSWFLLKPQHQTIFDLSSNLLYMFNLRDSCPHGLILLMDGFVLPPFESTFIFKDRDIISVKKKGGESTKTIKLGNGLNSLGELELVEQPPSNAGVKMLANDEFNKETGGYESQSKEDEQGFEPLENQTQGESTPIENMSSKKRKARDKLSSSRRKKCKLASAESSPVYKNDKVEVHLKKRKSSKQQTVLPEVKVVEEEKPVDIQGEPQKSRDAEVDEINAERLSKLDRTGKGSLDVSQTTGEAKKLPSRSARRKKAKRRWLREQAKIEKEKLHSNQLLGKANQQSPPKNNLKTSEEHIQPVSDNDVEDNVVPVVVRPGHIRFEPLGKDAEQTSQQSQISVKTFQWNGITSKKKGQKWGTEKSPFPERNDKSFGQMSSEMVAVEEQSTVTDDMDFDKLMPYSSLPKEGDLIAYRLVELSSSSWTPELCNYRVGKISHCDASSKRIILTPVPEYPIASEKKVDEEASEPPETSLYGEDGSLEIDYSSLIDVRLVKRGDSNNTLAVANGENEDVAILTSRQPNGSREVALASSTPAQGNGVVDAWEEISQALMAKKADLSEGGWNQTHSSGVSSWSYRALRRSALGPTMALLRSQNGI